LPIKPDWTAGVGKGRKLPGGGSAVASCCEPSMHGGHCAGERPPFERKLALVNIVSIDVKHRVLFLDFGDFCCLKHPESITCVTLKKLAHPIRFLLLNDGGVGGVWRVEMIECK
jgi:hypothetical protein